MRLNIGGRPISKVALAYLGSLLAIVAAAILAAGPNVVNWSGGEWVLFLIGVVGPPTVAFLKSLAPKDLVQIIQAIPPDVLEQYLRAAGALDRLKGLQGTQTTRPPS